MSWTEQAACRGMDPDIFFPHPRDYAGRKRALAVCGRCEVRSECLADAVEFERGHGFDHRVMAGIRGGMTVTRRVKQRRML